MAHTTRYTNLKQWSICKSTTLIFSQIIVSLKSKFRSRIFKTEHRNCKFMYQGLEFDYLKYCFHIILNVFYFLHILQTTITAMATRVETALSASISSTDTNASVATAFRGNSAKEVWAFIYFDYVCKYLFQIQSIRNKFTSDLWHIPNKFPTDKMKYVTLINNW